MGNISDFSLAMAPPSYSDIGKQARDVFGKGYHFGLVKLDVKSKTSSGVEFSAGGSSSTDGGKVTGSLETKYKIKEHGLSLTEKWNTDNSLNTTVDYDKLCDGLKLTLDGSFQPNSGDKSGKFKTEYKHEKFLFNADLNLASSMYELQHQLPCKNISFVAQWLTCLPLLGTALMPLATRLLLTLESQL